VRFGSKPSPSLVIALLALAVAIGGTALAGPPSPTTTAKRSAKVYSQHYAKAYAKKYAKRGARGATGAKGATGAPGLRGATGPEGAAKGGGGSVRVGGDTPLGTTFATVMLLSGQSGQKLRLGPGAWRVFGTAVMDVRLSDGGTTSQPSCHIFGENAPGFDFAGFPEEASLSASQPTDQLVLSARGEALVSSTRDFDVSIECSRDGDASSLTGAELDVWAVPAG
jgi:hypothetical protein